MLVSNPFRDIERDSRSILLSGEPAIATLLRRKARRRTSRAFPVVQDPREHRGVGRLLPIFLSVWLFSGQVVQEHCAVCRIAV